MAKDKSGFMSVDIGGPSDPTAAPTGLIEQAGAYEGQAAKIGGEMTAAAIDNLAKTGATAYQMYQYTEAAKEARDVMNRTFSPQTGWVGKSVGEFREKMANLDKLAGDQVEDIHSEMQALKSAAEAGILSPARADAELTSNLRRRIAANPGAAQSIRAAYEQYSGRGNWDILDMQKAFAHVNDPNAALKNAMKEAEKIPAAYRAITNDKGEMVGAFTVDELAQGYMSKQGPAFGAYLKYVNQERLAAAHTALDTAIKTNALEAGQKTVALKNTLDLGMETAFNQARIEMSGLRPESMKAEEIVAMTGVYRKRMEEATANMIAHAQKKMAESKMSPEEIKQMNEKIAQVRKEADTRIAAMTSSQKSFLDTISFFKTTGVQDVQALEIQAKVWDQMASSGFTPNQILEMKTPAGRARIRALHGKDPNHPLMLGVGIYEQLQSNLTHRILDSFGSVAHDQARMRTINRIADAMERGESVSDGTPIDPVNDPNALSAHKVVEERAKEVMKSTNIDISDKEANAIRANSATMSDSKDTVDSYIDFFKSGRAAKIDTDQKVATNVTERMTQWLMGDSDVHYPAKVKSFMLKNKVAVDPMGNIMIDRTSKEPWQVQAEAAATVQRANKMIELWSASSGLDRKLMAKAFADKVNSMPAVDRHMSTFYADANAQLIPDIKSNVAAFLGAFPGYKKLDDATRTIVDEALNGFASTLRYKGQAANTAEFDRVAWKNKTGKLYPTEKSMKAGMGNPAADTTSMFSNNDTEELQKELAKHKPGSVGYDVLKKELDSRNQAAE